MKNLLFISFCVLSLSVFSQSEKKKTDTIQPVRILKEIIIVGKLNDKKLNNTKHTKPLSSLDEYLEKSTRVNMIKRGNYAWEPAINNMVSERINITIDGMQIFGACTDKMDPITSYVDISNLSEAHIASGQQGSEYGQTIGGGINLTLDKSDFTNSGSNYIAGFDTGFDTNSNATVFGAEYNYSSPSFFLNTDVIYRDANNYFDGDGNEVLFSQFTKYNVSAVAGYKINEKSTLFGSLIFDEATNVGYPALPMDVSLAQAFISSISYEYSNPELLIKKTEVKLYANSITHVMDDTKRPNVPIHMDMPGWSDTYGFYIKAQADKNKHKFLFNVNGYYNKSLAEMTMYPANSNELLMFMLTWPDVRTLYAGLYAEDLIAINNKTQLKFTTRFGFQQNTIADDFGLGSLQIFYPDLKDNKTRILPSFSAQINHLKNNMNYTFSVGYGERAPSVSEGYGNFLYNSFDNFDYIGNPYLKNEKSIEFNAGFLYKKNKLRLTFDNSFFMISDYIIGEINPTYSPMVIGADGVKVYTGLDNVMVFSSSLSGSYDYNKQLTINAGLGYNYGKENNGDYLPLIAPFSYRLSVEYFKDVFSGEIEVRGEGDQHNFSALYGEDKTKGYAIVTINAGYNFYVNNDKIVLKTGIENVFNSQYSTYSDWKNIPRKGRGVYINLSYILK